MWKGWIDVKKRCLLLLALCLLFVLPAAVRAADAAEESVLVDWMYAGEDAVMLMDADTDALNALFDVLTAAVTERQPEIDLSSFGIPADTMGSLFRGWMEEHPELYYVDKGIMVWKNSLTGIVSKIEPSYLEGLDEASAEVFEAVVAEALGCVLPGMDDVQKALVLHDWVVQNVEYDETQRASRRIYSAYGALVEHLAVCEGYARAYQLLLKRCGIDCVFVTSDGMEHAWNAVKLGENWYHADTTWDDSGTDDEVRHRYFLFCDDTFWSSREHYGWVMKVSCDDASLDDAFWDGVESAICFPNVEEAWYLTEYFDKSIFKMQIALVSRSWETGEVTAKATVTDRWYVWNDSESLHPDAYTTLCVWDGSLYFNDSLHIYRYDPETGTTETAFTYDGSTGYFYGLRPEGDRLLVFVSTAPNVVGTWYDTGLEPTTPAEPEPQEICEYDAEALTVTVNDVFAGENMVLCAGYDADGRLLYACFLTPDEDTVLPEAAASVRLFRLDGAYAPVGEFLELTA